MPSIAVRDFIHVVAAVIRDPFDPQSLFITRRPQGKHLQGLWEFPGGKLEPGEHRFAALRRELQEETGIQLISARPFQSIFHRYKEKNIYLDVWEVTDYLGIPTGQEGQEVKWEQIADLSMDDFPEADRAIIKALALPNELLITPDLPEHDLDNNVVYFEQLMNKHVYPVVLLRSHHLSDEQYHQLAIEFSGICKQFHSDLVITRPTLKQIKNEMFNDFQSIHLNSYILQSLTDNPFSDGRRVSASCHDQHELRMAANLDVQFAIVSTVRETLSHPGRAAKGWSGFKRLADKAEIPVYALGGIKRRDFSSSRYQGAIGVAGISDFWTV